MSSFVLCFLYIHPDFSFEKNGKSFLIEKFNFISLYQNQIDSYWDFIVDTAWQNFNINAAKIA